MAFASNPRKKAGLRHPWLAALGRMVFGKRLFLGLAVACVGLEALRPRPLFSQGHRLGHSLDLLAVAAGLTVRAWGGGCAGTHTRSGKIEAPRLITGGPYAYVRNPIYGGTIILGFGMAALIGDPLGFGLAALAFALLYFGIVPAEEEFLLHQFGADYERYRRAVPRFIPRLRPWPERAPTGFSWSAARGELFITLILVGIYGALLVEEYLDALGVS
jgi:protein-S-isoprenylcysteine O-methyltransferase Ste14